MFGPNIFGDCLATGKWHKRNTYTKNIRPHSRSWTARVQVLEKSFPRTPYHASQKYQRLILVDGQGTRVQATIFDRDIDLFANSLNILGHYYISNAMVKPIAEKHRIVNLPYQWIISTRTLENLIAAPFSLVPFCELEKHMDSASQVDIIAARIISFPWKTLKSETTFQEVLLIDQELKPIILTLWNEFLLMKEKKSIKSSKHNQSLLYHLSHKIFKHLSHKRCYSRNKCTTRVKKYKVSSTTLKVPSTTLMKDPNSVDVIQISTLLADDKNALSWWIKAFASITNYNHKFWYTGCNVCWRAIYADHDQTFTCRNCLGQEVAETRCRFLIEHVDPTGTIVATIFGKFAEKIF
ncbi:Replication protein A 70 kDa DNA-binding subunit B [Bienertia sinuspersici]